MSFVLEAVRDKPVGLWLCDGTSPFTDYSGYNKSATISTVGNSIGLVNGASKSLLTSGTHVATFSTPVFVKSSENQAFSIEVWVRKILRTGSDPETQIFGNLNQMDGLVIDGTEISFVTKYATTGEARASYDLQTNRAVHLVGVHLNDKNQLYIDGVLVDEQEITLEQQGDVFVTTDNNLYSGTNSASVELAINGVATYGHGLSSDAVARHYTIGRDSTNQPVDYYGVEVIELADAGANILFETVFDTEEDWDEGEMVRTTTEDDMLLPQFVTGAAVPGTWQTAIDLYNADSPDTIQSVNINWDGRGPVVEASLNGTTWTAVQQNVSLSIIPAGFNPTEKELYLRVSFLGGANDESYLKSLTVRGYKSATYTENDVTTITYTGQPDIALVEDEPALSDAWGIILDTTQYLTLSSDYSISFNPQTIELWVKVFDSTVNIRLLDTRNSSATTNPFLNLLYSSSSFSTQNATLYKNGATPTGSPVVGEWMVLHLVCNAPVTTDVLLNTNYLLTNHGNVQIGKVIYYSDALTATQISDIVKSYFGTPSMRFSDASVIGIAESAASSTIYAHDWSVLTAG